MAYDTDYRNFIEPTLYLNVWNAIRRYTRPGRSLRALGTKYNHIRGTLANFKLNNV